MSGLNQSHLHFVRVGSLYIVSYDCGKEAAVHYLLHSCFSFEQSMSLFISFVCKIRFVCPHALVLSGNFILYNNFRI